MARKPVPTGGQIRVLAPEALVDIIDAAGEAPYREDSPAQSVPYSRGISQQMSFPASSSDFTNVTNVDDLEDRKAARERKYQLKLEQIEKQRKKQLDTYQARRDQKFQQRFDTLMHERATFVRDIANKLEVKDAAQDRQRQLLYKHWCEQIFDPIQTQIAEQVDGTSSKELSRRKREQFEAFLKASNERDLFRDIIAESDYDPLQARESTLKYSLKGAQDPIKKDLHRVRDERKRMGDPLADETSPSGRPTDVKKWTQMSAVTAFYDRQSTPKSDASTLKSRSNVAFDHFTFPKDVDAVKAEYPKGKRVFADKH
eukprot:TRINITY_DN9017_c0_g1_i1.p1 TRINITY_DN9017_c0_g1~~TRINITY_DN9017_c0_g1_i1.p1  ORF type:complete len:361 (-),score=61.60 TRINITY_DN9017_c0_g1_i1:70-1011(-)